MLMSLRPVAVQAGTAAEITVSSRYNLSGAYQVLVSGEGVAGEVVPPDNKPSEAKDSAAQGKSDGKPEEPPKKPNVEKLNLRITAAADAQPGIRDVRVATPQGVSTVAQLVVVRDPVASESGTNDTPAQAQPIELPTAVCGAIEKNEDVDYFKFHAEAGDALVSRPLCAVGRPHPRLADACRSDSDAPHGRRATLAACDNNGYYADPVLAYRFDQAGDYLLEIRDVRYQGNQYWEYCIEISSRPLIESVYPLAATVGQVESFEPVGHLLPADARLNWRLSASLPLGLATVQLPLGQLSAGNEQSNPVTLVVTDLPLVRECEATNDVADSAQPFAAPGGVNARIEREGDIDCFAFDAKKGEAFSLEVVARRAQSGSIRTLNPRRKSKQLV
jgi:hypothetical protein